MRPAADHNIGTTTRRKGVGRGGWVTTVTAPPTMAATGAVQEHLPPMETKPRPTIEDGSERARRGANDGGGDELSRDRC